jgi:hypothetical protein
MLTVSQLSKPQSQECFLGTIVRRNLDSRRTIPFPDCLRPVCAANIIKRNSPIARVEPFFKENGFYEKEIARRTEQFGNIAHVWSIYESRHNKNDPEPFMRGINSIQLFNDGKRWWIVNIYWQQESAENPIPQKYLN